MSRRTRLFLIGSASILVAGLGTGLLASYMGLQRLTIVGSNGPAELAYIPEDATLVAYANVRDVMDSELRRKLLEMRPGADPNGDREFESRTGIDLERDVDRVVASLAGATQGDGALVVARGRFDDTRIEGLMRERGAVVEDYRGTRLLTTSAPAGRDDAPPFALAFVEPGLIAFGSPEAVRLSIDTASGPRDVTDNSEMMRLVRDVDQGSAWAVGHFDAVAGRARLPDGMASQLAPVTWFAASGEIQDGVQGLLRVEANSDQAAADLREVVRGLIALARLQQQERTGLSAVVDSLQLGGEGNTVSVAFSVPPDAIDALARMPRRQPRAPQPPPPPPAF